MPKYARQLTYTPFKEFSELNNWIFVSVHEILKAKDILQKSAKISQILSRYEINYFFYGCLVETKLTNLEKNDTWGIQISSNDSSDLEKVAKELDLPLENSKDSD